MTRASSSSRRRQHRRQMKKTKVFSGFTNQLKVFGRLWGKTRCQVPPGSPSGSSPASRASPSLGLLQGLGLLPPLPHWPLLCLLHGQQLNSASTIP